MCEKRPSGYLYFVTTKTLSFNFFSSSIEFQGIDLQKKEKHYHYFVCLAEWYSKAAQTPLLDSDPCLTQHKKLRRCYTGSSP